MLTYGQARAHALQCGILKSNTQAVPISGNRHDNPVYAFLAHPVESPEDGRVLYQSCFNLTASMMANLSIQYGIDYIVCYK